MTVIKAQNKQNNQNNEVVIKNLNGRVFILGYCKRVQKRYLYYL